MIGPKISAGNSKLGKIPNISLPPVLACANSTACRAKCYALKAWRQYPATRRAWGHNFRLWRRDPGAYWQGIRNYLEAKRPPFFRWHVAGDIQDQSYLDKMRWLAVAFPETRFLCFTKRFDLDYGWISGNLVIRFSLWPGLALPRWTDYKRPMAWYQDGNETRIPKGAKVCPGSCAKCRHCWTSSRDVVFKAH
jgi:hypothetical protein